MTIPFTPTLHPHVSSRLARLPEQERAIIEAMIVELCDIPGLGPLLALEIIEAVCRWRAGEKRGRNGQRNEHETLTGF